MESYLFFNSFNLHFDYVSISVANNHSLNKHISPSGNNHYALIIVVSGSVQITYNKQMQTMITNQLILFPLDMKITVKCTSTVTAYCLIFSINEIDTDNRDGSHDWKILFPNSRVFSIPLSKLIIMLNLINDLSDYQSNTLSLSYLLHSCIFEISDQLKLIEENKSSDGGRSIQEINKWILLNFGKKLTINDVATRFGYSDQYFGTFFKKHNQLTFSTYLKNIRIAYAKEQLRLSNKKVKEIARLSGFPDEKHFMRVFQKEIGITPTAYRKKDL
jgi:YesN/AraC family two-component response regulator